MYIVCFRAVAFYISIEAEYKILQAHSTKCMYIFS